MSFRASLSVLLGCHFGQAQKLLTAAEIGKDSDVKEVLQSKPQLAAFAGWHGTTTPLHRAAAGGHLSTVQAILELIKLKAAAAEEAAAAGRGRSTAARRWLALLRTVIDQRTHRGQTALMLACERGHTAVVTYLLAQGADALAVDMIHARTALHYAAIGGHAGCVRALCSDSATVDIGNGARRPLRDVVTADMQVQSAKFIDQRSMGGLTALHFAAVSGSLDTLQALLRAGASIMVKTDGEAFIGQEYLTPGSTPLHISVLVGSMPLAHALLQAHAGMMAVAGTGGTRDERRRRPWEGHSRSDIRSMRNAARKLPYHLARDRGWAQMMHLVDPRVPVDSALDAARDTDHGIGPKNLATICSIVLQQSLLDWLDQRASELETEREAEARAAAGEAAAEAGLTLVRPPSRSSPLKRAASGTATPVLGAGEPGVIVTPRALAVALPPLASAQTLEPPARSAPPESPFATAAVTPFTAEGPSSAPAIASLPPLPPGASASGLLRSGGALPPRGPRRLTTASSAPVSPLLTPRQRSFSEATAPDVVGPSGAPAAPPAGPSTAPAVAMLSMERMESLHTYLGMLSVRRPAPPEARRHARAATMGWGELSWSPPGKPKRRGSGMPRARSTGALQHGLLDVPVTGDAAVAITVAPAAAPTAPPTAQTADQGATGAMRRVFSSLRDKLKTPEAAAAAGVEPSPAESPTADPADAKLSTGPGTVDSGDDCKSLGAASCSGDSGSGSADVECGVCLDRAVEVAFAGCEHALCLDCARSLTQQERKPPTCPFCRRMVVGFLKVPSAGAGAAVAGH